MDEKPLTLALACTVVALAASMPSSRARRLVPAGWVMRAIYDAAFTHDANVTRLPGWYPPFRAGVDVAMGARLALTNLRRCLTHRHLPQVLTFARRVASRRQPRSRVGDA